MLDKINKKLESFMYRDKLVESKNDAFKLFINCLTFFSLIFCTAGYLVTNIQNSAFYKLDMLFFIGAAFASSLFASFLRYFSDKEMIKIINKREEEYESVIEDPNIRWEKGVSHHTKSKKLYNFIAGLDWEYGNDMFELKKGGDGDNGEQLMYYLDAYFEKEDIIEKDLYRK